MATKKLLILLPDKDFDVTETSVPWRLLTNAHVNVQFTTASGAPGVCDQLLLTGVIFGKLGAAEEAKKFYSEMIESEEFKNPQKYSEVDFMAYDAVLLPGGHAQGMKPYLENTIIRDKLVPFINDKSKIVGAVCHGTIVLARAIDPSTGKSLLYDRKSTCLPKYMERSAYFMTSWKLGRYYRTYDIYVEDEVKAAMRKPDEQFKSGPGNYFASLDRKCAFVCTHDNYISARWPGDVYLFAETILEKLKS